MLDKENIVKTIVESDATRDIVNKTYDDGISPTVRESGKVLELVPRTVRALLAPLEKWVINKEAVISEANIRIANKLEKVKLECLVEPMSYVAIPTLQALSYSINDDNLVDMYCNLLSKSMNINTKDFVHPGFVDIIKQLSPVDAFVLKEISEKNPKPLIDLYIRTKNNGNIAYTLNITWIKEYSQKIVDLSISNLVRLGVIKVGQEPYVNDDLYDIIRDTSNYIDVKNQLTEKELGEVVEDKKHIDITAFGENFYNICILPISEKDLDVH